MTNMTLQRSRTCRNRIGMALDAAGLATSDAAVRLGVPPALLDALVGDDRLLPPGRLLQGLCFLLAVQPHDLVTYDPTVSDLATLLGISQRQRRPRIAILGAGNLGHVMAGILGARDDLEVTLLVSSPERRAVIEAGLDGQAGIEVRFPDRVVTGRPDLITVDPEEAVDGAAMVLLCVPSHVEPPLLARIAPHLEPAAMVGAIPAAGGFQWAAAQALLPHRSDVTIFGLAAIPWMCQLVAPGRAVRVLGTKTIDAIAVAADGGGARVADALANLTSIPFLDIGNFLQITLNPGNQLLHPGILHRLFDGRVDAVFSEPPLFYESLDEAGAGLLQAMSDELVALCGAIEARTGVDLGMVLPLQLSILASHGPAVADPTSLRSTIATNRAYAGIRTPMTPVEGGYRLNRDSRFFFEDVPFGLVVLRGIADTLGQPVPTIDRLLAWMQAIMGRSYLVDGRLDGPDLAASGAPQRYGFTTIEEIVRPGIS
jgi:hypothetical protein